MKKKKKKKKKSRNYAGDKRDKHSEK